MNAQTQAVYDWLVSTGIDKLVAIRAAKYPDRVEKATRTMVRNNMRPTNTRGVDFGEIVSACCAREGGEA